MNMRALIRITEQAASAALASPPSRPFEWLLEDAEVIASRKQRAQQMGFDTSRVWYHGTAGTAISAFDPDRLGHNTGAKSATKGFFFTSDPDVAEGYGKGTTYMPDASSPAHDAAVARLAEIEGEMAEVEARLWAGKGEEEEALRRRAYTGPKAKRLTGQAYWDAARALDQKYDTEENRALNLRAGELYREKADLTKRVEALSKMGWMPRAVVHPVYLKMLRPLVHDMRGETYREVSYNDLLVSARRGRRDGAIIRNTYDPGYRGANNPMCDIAVVFQPSQIRSIFAHFDPAKADSPDIGA